MTTSKLTNGKFYFSFSKTGSINEPSDSTDYLDCPIEDQALIFIFDPNNKDNFYYSYPFIMKERKRKIDLIRLPQDEMSRKFYHPGAGTAPDTLKSPYQKLLIMPMSNVIIYQKDSTFNSQIRIKDGV